MSSKLNPALSEAPAEPPRILVVEDEFLIRMLVADHLRDGGFAVLEAANGDEAVAILKSGAPIDLIFTDVRMPGTTDGLGLLEYARQAWPDVPVVMTSGHLEPNLAYSAGAARFLPKPCGLDELTGTIRAALEIRP